MELQERVPSPAEGDDDVIGARVGNYVVERKLADGGMASVYLAVHPALGKQVAVKFLRGDLVSQGFFADRFVEEARLTSSLRHPHVVEIYDFGELKGRPYYIMELLRGRDLATLLDQSPGPQPLELCASFIEQICLALQAAHEQGIVHRDLKPSNIFALDAVGDHPPKLKLMDFGVAKVMADTSALRTRSGEILGTPTHMAPEQALGRPEAISPATDLYSLGVIAYQLLTGSLPFEHDSEVMLMTMHIRDPVPSVLTRQAGIPPRLAALVESCLAKDPKQRPASAQTVAARFSASVRAALLLQDEGAGAAPQRVPSAAGRGAARPDLSSPAFTPLASREEVSLSAVVPMPLRGPGAGAADNAEPAPPNAPPMVPMVSAVGLGGSFSAFAAAPPAAPVAPVVEGGGMRLRQLQAQGKRDQRVLVPGSEQAEPGDEPPAEVTAPSPAEVDGAATVEPPSEAPPAPLLPSLHPEAEQVAKLSAGDEVVLDKLLRQMERKGDLPAFVRSVGEISQKADATSAFSARQLSESILKDYALTAKLLRVVNTSYAQRSGCQIYSVQHAVVILGFDRIRSLALGISVFRSTTKKAAGPGTATDHAIRSLVAGEIARVLAPAVGVDDPERAMLCAVFRNLGNQLAVQYLPEKHAEIRRLQQERGLTAERAAEQVLGTSLLKLGLRVAERWRLPEAMMHAMANTPGADAPLPRQQDRLAALAAFANALCTVVAEGQPRNWQQELGRLLVRFRNLLTIGSDDMPALLTQAREAFETRFSAAIGEDWAKSHLRQQVHTFSGTVPEEQRTGPAMSSEEIASSIAPFLTSEGTARAWDSEELERALALVAQATKAHHVALLRGDGPRGKVNAVAVSGQDAVHLLPQLEFPPPAASDHLGQALQQGRDVYVSDCFDRAHLQRLPQRYFEALGSPTLALLACTAPGVPTVALLINAQELPDPSVWNSLASLRAPFALSAAGRS